MSYQVSARKWRPQSFDEVVGQRHVARTLMNAIAQGRLAQAYLFSGTRGVGKTTMARILAKALNCSGEKDGVSPCQACESCIGITAGNSPDVIEIDGASNRGIDEVRELREIVKYAPMGGRHKVFIIDEVHMLTKEAFNALLKTLEEPPPHVVFIFATTEDHKIPTTILSRCQHFHFKRISRREMTGQLERILKEEKIQLSSRGLSMIAKAAEGSLRDSLSLLDQAVAYGGREVSDEDLQTILGTAGREQLLILVEHILKRRAADGLAVIKELTDQGYDLRQFILSLIEYFRHLVVARESKNPEALIDLPPEELEEVKRLSASHPVEELQRLFGVFSTALEGFRTAVYPSYVLEMALVRATRIPPLESFEKLLERLDDLEGPGPAAPPHAGGRDVPSAPKTVQEKKTAAVVPEPEKRPETREAVPPPVIPGAVGSDTGSEDLKDRWINLIHQVRSEKPNLGSYIEQGVPREIVHEKESEWLVVGFHDGSSFLADLIQKEENKGIIEAAAKEAFGRVLQLRLVRVERSASEREAANRAEEGKAEKRKKKARKDALSNPLLKDAMNILGGEVIDIRES